jgi:UDP-N-acetylglucosamine 2-epimerase (non-hydrolysing)
MEAGNRCFDLRVPEEINRKVVDHLSDVNLVYTEHARRYLISEGIAAANQNPDIPEFKMGVLQV